MGYLKQCLPKAGLIWEADPYCLRLDQTQGWSHGSPTVPAMPPFDSRRPKSFKCRADFERHYSSEKEAATCWELTLSGEMQCPTFRKGESTFTTLRVPLGGCYSRYEDIHGPKWCCGGGEMASILLRPISCITLMKWWRQGVGSKGIIVSQLTHSLHLVLHESYTTGVHTKP